jgi:hypothetical protein
MATIVGVDMMRGAIFWGFTVMVPVLANGQEPNRTPGQQLAALLKEYSSAGDIWSKKYDVCTVPGDAVKRHQDWPG